MASTFIGERYRVESELGSGGSAQVFLVTDLVLDRPAALKLLHPPDGRGGELPAALGPERLLRKEARALASLDHPHVVRVYDLGAHEDREYIVMEYLERGSLADVLRLEGPLAPARAVELVLQVLDGLAAAHAAGIVHRDVKPGNVLLRADGTVALCDFGIARTEGGGDTRTGVALGSLGFMAPEQRVDARRAGPQADLYGAACTLYNLVTADTPVDLYLAQDHSPRWESVPSPLRPVLRRATRSEPSQRFVSSEEMAEALRAVLPALTGLPPARSARTPSVAHPPTRVDPEPTVAAERRARATDVAEWQWANRRRSPVGRTAVWVGAAATLTLTVAFASVGPLGGRLGELAVAPASAPEEPAPELAGTWIGTFDGHRGQIVLRGSAEALEGDVEVRLGAHELRSRVRGSFRDGRLELDEASASPPERYRAALGKTGLVLEGQLERDGVAPLPFALVRVDR